MPKDYKHIAQIHVSSDEAWTKAVTVRMRRDLIKGETSDVEWSGLFGVIWKK